MNTWKMHGSGNRPDAPGVGPRHGSENASFPEENKGVHARGVSYQHGKVLSRMMPQTNEFSAVPHTQSLRSQNKNSLQATDPSQRDTISTKVLQNDGVQQDLKSDHLVNDSQARFLFARTRSSPELTDVVSQVRRNREAQTATVHTTSARLDNSTNRKKNLESESSLSHISHAIVEDISSVHGIPQPSVDAASDSNNSSNSYHQDMHLDGLSEEFSSAEVMHNEEQDLVNLMASASLQSFNGHLHGQFNLNPANLPFSIPPSLIASMAYPQRNHPGFFPANTPFIDPSFANMQFPHGMVSPQFTHYFPGIGMNLPSENSFDWSSENFGSVEVKPEELDNDFWQEQNVSSSSCYDSENGNTDIIQSEDKPSSFSGLKYVPPPRMNNSGSASRGQQKHTREKRGALTQNSSTLPMQDDINCDAYSEERLVSSRFSSAAHSNSFRSRTSSESSRDGSSAKTPKSAKEKRGKKVSNTNLAAGNGKGKSVSDHASNQAEEDDLECASLSNKGKELVERNPGSEPIAALQIPRHNISGFEVAQTSGSESMVPFAPMLIDPGSRHRAKDNSGLIAFYPTGPAIPFLTMLPVYNVPPETGTSDQSSSRYEGDESTENNESVQSFNSEGYDHSDDLNTSSSFRGTTPADTFENKKPDILNSDFLSHWQNLQFGRYCQNPRNQGPLLYPSPVMVPPAYLQGRFPYENSGRPFPTNKNLFSQLMTSYGQRLVPLAPIQSASSRPASPYQPYIDDLPRYRSGTGTYLPNPNQTIPARERHSSGTRRGSYNHDRNDNYGDREGNWNANSKPRASPRSHNRSQQDKLNSRADRLASNDSRADRSWNSYRHESVPSYQSQDGSLNTSSSQNGPQNMAYSMYPMAASGPTGASSGPSGPPVMMLYPFDHNANYGPQGKQVEFGSIGSAGMNEQMQLNDGTRTRAFEDHRHHRSNEHRSSPDRPSSSHRQR